MKSYYGPTVVGLILALAATAAAAIFANAAAGEANARYSRTAADVRDRRDAQHVQRKALIALQDAIEPVRRFSSAWHRAADVPGKQPADAMRTEIEMIAQRQLGLVTDGAITPQPERYSFAGVYVPVQRLTLRASGKDLAGLLTWLGSVEEKYPLAVIELCEFSSNIGGNTGLTIRLAQPLKDVSSLRPVSFRGPEGRPASPTLIMATQWSEYSPSRLKCPVAVGFDRNPLQPAVVPEATRMHLSRDAENDVAAKLESIVASRLHSVVRGPVPLINIDGRLFRVGDEVVLGTKREKLLGDTHTKLKQIGNQQLVFHLSGGSAPKPVDCDVAYRLPAFFQAR